MSPGIKAYIDTLNRVLGGYVEKLNDRSRGERNIYSQSLYSNNHSYRCNSAPRSFYTWVEGYINTFLGLLFGDAYECYCV